MPGGAFLILFFREKDGVHYFKIEANGLTFAPFKN
jgi:hypothetical protein